MSTPRDVDAFVEQIDREDRLQLAAFEPLDRVVPELARTLAGDRFAREAGLREATCHEAGVLDGDAEAERPHPPRVSHAATHLREHELDPTVVAGIEPPELGEIVAGAPPFDVGQVGAIVHPEVLKGRQQALLERFPQAHLVGGPPVEPAPHIAPIVSLGRRREAKQDDGAEMGEQALIGRRLGVMELVDDHDIEAARIDGTEVKSREGLDRGEDILSDDRPLAAPIQLAKAPLPEDMAVRGAALLQDALPVSDEEKSIPRELSPQPLEVEGSHERLARTRRSDHEVAVVATRALEAQRLEDLLLIRVRSEVEGQERRQTSRFPFSAERSIDPVAITFGVVRFELG